VARPERFELPTYSSEGCSNNQGYHKISQLSSLGSGCDQASIGFALKRRQSGDFLQYMACDSS